MKHLLCMISFHVWSENLSTFLIPDIRYSARRCRRCGKIKEALWDSAAYRYIRLPKDWEEMREFEPIWKSVLAQAKSSQPDPSHLMDVIRYHGTMKQPGPDRSAEREDE